MPSSITVNSYLDALSWNWINTVKIRSKNHHNNKLLIQSIMEKLQLQNKSVLITGADSGIGKSHRSFIC